MVSTSIATRFSTGLSRTPWPLGVAAGVVAVFVGAFLTVKPFSSLAVLVVAIVVALAVSGVVDLLAADGGDDGRRSLVRGSVQLAAAVAIVAWPGAGVRVVTALVSVSLVVGGGADLVQGLRARGRRRWGELATGTASILLGGLALAWPDVSVIVIAIAFGVRMILFGARLAVASWRRRRTGPTSGPAVLVPAAPTSLGWLALTGRVAGLLAVLGLVATSLLLQHDAPRPDAFYAAPSGAAGAKPGTLLRTEVFTRDVPAGAKAWRILYATTREDGSATVGSAIVVTPRAASSTPRPLIAWAHGTTGWAPGCAPSILEHPFESGALFSLDEVMAQGWTLVAPDYTGLGTTGPHPYLIGSGEARSVLDSIRATRQLPSLSLTESTVIWGHSQGGHAALWTGILAPTYAPDLSIAGVAALAPAANLPALVDNVGAITGGSLFAAYVVQAYTDIYPDVSYTHYIRPGARVLVHEMADRCLASKGVLVSVASALVLDKPIWQRDPHSGAFATRLAQNTPSGPIAAPVLIEQGEADSLVTAPAQAAYVSARCAGGGQVDYRTYPGLGHVPLVEAGSPAITDLFAWTADRLAGKPAHSTCP